MMEIEFDSALRRPERSPMVREGTLDCLYCDENHPYEDYGFELLEIGERTFSYIITCPSCGVEKELSLILHQLIITLKVRK